jgi:hypothetical protein
MPLLDLEIFASELYVTIMWNLCRKLKETRV